jgi:hypothetical protein
METNVTGGLLGPPLSAAEEARLSQQYRERKEAEARHEERLLKTCEELIQLWQPGLADEIAAEAAIVRDPQIDKDWNAFRISVSNTELKAFPLQWG